MLPPEPVVVRHAAPVSIFAVIVLYKLRPEDSPSYRSLLSALARAPKENLRLRVLLYDNTPTSRPPTDLPEFVSYVPSSINTGLATAYNLALETAAKENIVWLLTLDQDTGLPDTFLEQLTAIANEQRADQCVAAIVPHVHSGTRVLSPYSLRWHLKPCWFARDFQSIPKNCVYAINSGALLRVAAVQEVHGYNKLFWLDASDFYLFRRLERACRKVFVAGTISLQHDLSLNDVDNKMSLTRYTNALRAGSAFYDMEFGGLTGFGHTLLLFQLYVKQLRRHQEIATRRATLSIIRSRLLESRTQRLQSWLASEDERIAAWQTHIEPMRFERGRDSDDRLNTDKMPLRPVSILAVIVLYKTSPKDCLTVQTLSAAAAQIPSGALRFKTVLYDNTPEYSAAPSSEPGIVYIAASRNDGVAEAYNRAMAIADSEDFDWILTLDQDTELPMDFLIRMADIIQQIGTNKRVAAILPLIRQGHRVLSPHWFRFDFFPRAFSASAHGVQRRSVYGFNSGSILRTRALQNIGGYNPLFWLDYSDAYVFRMFHLFGYKTFVAGHVAIQHHLSVLNTEEISDDRYRNIVQAGSAFCDLYRNWLVRVEFTWKLVRSYIGQTRKANSQQKKQILLEAIRDRLFKSRSRRIQGWIRQQTTRRQAVESV